MKASKRIIGLSLLVVGLVWAWIAGCSDPVLLKGGNECYGNTGPQIGNLVLLINDQAAEGDVVVQQSDELQLWFEYIDPDCNLAGGDIWLQQDDTQFVRVASLPDDLPCRGSGEGRGYGYVLPLQGLEAADHTFVLGVSDACGSQSDTLDGAFTLQGGDDDTTDDDSDDDSADDDTFDGGLLRNGDFELGHQDWIENPTGSIISKFSLIMPPFSGNYAAIFGRSDQAIENLAQNIKIPTGTTSLTLQFELIILSDEPVGGNHHDTLNVELLDFTDTVIVNFYNFSDVDEWASWKKHTKQVDLPGYGGQTVKLRFRSHSDQDDKLTYFEIDDVALFND